MSRRMVFGIILTLIIVGVLLTAFYFTGFLAAEPIRIRSDGSVTPSSAPITRNGDVYTLTGNVNTDIDGIVIERSNMTLNGGGYTIHGSASGNGLSLNAVSNVAIENITVNGFNQGVVFSNFTHDCVLFGNNITYNTLGIFLNYSSNNSIHHNNFINNTQQALISNSANYWDIGYPRGGNYWSSNIGIDSFRGVHQNETASDAIDDTAYVFDANNTDYYPLMGPFGPLTMAGANVTVFPDIDVGLIFENVAAEGSSTVNKTSTAPVPPSGFKLVGQYMKIDTTADYSGQIRLRIVYDDSNMTLEEEMSLQLAHWNETALQWVNITTYVDVVNNVIYGEESHLTGHGVFSRIISGIGMTEFAPSKTTVTNDNITDGSDLIIVSRHHRESNP